MPREKVNTQRRGRRDMVLNKYHRHIKDRRPSKINLEFGMLEPVDMNLSPKRMLRPLRKGHQIII